MEQEYFQNDCGFLFKIYTKANNYNFSAKNLLASFNLKLFSNLKNFSALINPMKKNSPFYMETEEKQIDKYLIEIFREEKILSEKIYFRQNLLNIFHFNLNIPKYYLMENCIFQSKTMKKIFWKFNSLHLDFLTISRINGKNYFSDFRQNFSDIEIKSKQSSTIKRKIRIDQLLTSFNLILFKKKQKTWGDERSIKHFQINRPPSSSTEKVGSSYKIGDILAEKNSKEKHIIVSKYGKNFQLLSLENTSILLEFKNLERRFFKMNPEEIKYSKGYDKSGQLLTPGKFCQILNGKFQNTECKILYLWSGKLFAKVKIETTNQANIVTLEQKYVMIFQMAKYESKIDMNKNNRYISITNGEFKGYKCKVLNTEGNFLEVLILSTSKIIKLSKKNVKFF